MTNARREYLEGLARQLRVVAEALDRSKLYRMSEVCTDAANELLTFNPKA